MSRVFASLSLAFLSLCFGAQLSADPPSKDKDDPATKVQSKLDIFSELTGGKGGSLGAIGAGKELTLSAEFKVAENGRDGVLSVKAVMAEGWHTYSTNQPRPMGTKLSV